MSPDRQPSGPPESELNSPMSPSTAIRALPCNSRSSGPAAIAGKDTTMKWASTRGTPMQLRSKSEFKPLGR